MTGNNSNTNNTSDTNNTSNTTNVLESKNIDITTGMISFNGVQNEKPYILSRNEKVESAWEIDPCFYSECRALTYEVVNVTKSNNGVYVRSEPIEVERVNDEGVVEVITEEGRDDYIHYISDGEVRWSNNVTNLKDITYSNGSVYGINEDGIFNISENEVEFMRVSGVPSLIDSDKNQTYIIMEDDVAKFNLESGNIEWSDDFFSQEYQSMDINSSGYLSVGTDMSDVKIISPDGIEVKDMELFENLTSIRSLSLTESGLSAAGLDRQEGDYVYSINDGHLENRSQSPVFLDSVDNTTYMSIEESNSYYLKAYKDDRLLWEVKGLPEVKEMSAASQERIYTVLDNQVSRIQKYKTSEYISNGSLNFDISREKEFQPSSIELSWDSTERAETATIRVYKNDSIIEENTIISDGETSINFNEEDFNMSDSYSFEIIINRGDIFDTTPRINDISVTIVQEDDVDT
jgi:hypothetical protein